MSSNNESHLDTAVNEGFINRLTVVRIMHPSHVPHVNIYDDGTYTCGICHEQLAKTEEGWAHP